MIKIAIVGTGKMGLSHQAIANMHPKLQVVGVCDTSSLLLGILERYSGVPTFRSLDRMLDETTSDAVIVATPSSSHAAIVEQVLQRGAHVFCEKPLTLAPSESARLATLARARGVVTQVGYHYRFVSPFREVKTLLDQGAIGEVTHAIAEAYGPVVLAPRGKTWRANQGQGGGCLFDYAAHAINLLNWYFGSVTSAEGVCLKQIFSTGVEDEVHASLAFENGVSAQLSANWSDESERKMRTRITVWGAFGRIEADRQECRTYLRQDAAVPPGYTVGWNIRYGTELTLPVWFYLRGEEYSAQIDDFAERISLGELNGVNSFDAAVETDLAIGLILESARAESRSTERGIGPHVADDDTRGVRRRAPNVVRAMRGLWTSNS